MKRDIEVAKKTGADGVVIDVLNRDYTMDAPRVNELMEVARPLNVTFHRAFDEARGQVEAMEEIIHLGIDRILTSGGKRSVSDGLGTVKDLVGKSNGRVVIMAVFGHYDAKRGGDHLADRRD